MDPSRKEQKRLRRRPFSDPGSLEERVRWKYCRGSLRGRLRGNAPLHEIRSTCPAPVHRDGEITHFLLSLTKVAFRKNGRPSKKEKFITSPSAFHSACNLSRRHSSRPELAPQGPGRIFTITLVGEMVPPPAPILLPFFPR